MQEMWSIPVLELSPGGGNGNPLQSSCLGNPMDRETWRATVHGVTELDTAEAAEHMHAQRSIWGELTS